MEIRLSRNDTVSKKGKYRLVLGPESQVVVGSAYEWFIGSTIMKDEHINDSLCTGFATLGVIPEAEYDEKYSVYVDAIDLEELSDILTMYSEHDRSDNRAELLVQAISGRIAHVEMNTKAELASYLDLERSHPVA